MKTTRTDRRNPVTSVLFLGLFVAGTLLGACAGGDDPPAEDGQANEEAAAGVEYEPAYPEEVSAEELSAEDTAQQEAHTHADGTSHSHGEEDDHDHGEGEGEHEHDGDEDHDH